VFFLLVKFYLLPYVHILTAKANLQIPIVQVGVTNLKIQQAKKYAVTQAQQEGWLGNFRSFDSPFGNYLVPLIPTHADLFG